MIVPIPRSARTSEENVLPLINIVFLLLIFFMIAGALSATAPFPLEPPEVDAAAEAEAPRGGIAIGATGELAFDGVQIEADELSARITHWQETADADADAVLSVRADARADSEQLLAVIGQLREAGIDRVRLFAVASAEAE